MGLLAKALYEEHQAGGSGARDFSSIVERLRERPAAGGSMEPADKVVGSSQ